MTIHAGHPFATPEEDRRPVRRLRGRLALPVTLWTAGTADAGAGLPVTSTLLADGDPGRLLGVLDAESELYETLTGTGRFTVQVLDPAHQRVADEFAGVVPVPGGAFRNHGWVATDWGPVLQGARTWAGCRSDTARPLGWGMLVEATVEYVEIGESEPLVYHRGRYRTLR